MGKTLCCVFAGLVIAVIVMAARVQAAEGDPERSLQTTARVLRELSERLQVALVEGREMSADIALLKGLDESLQSTDLLIRERLRVRGDALQQLSGEGALRHQLAVERYQSTVTRLHAAIAKVATAVVPDQLLLDEFFKPSMNWSRFAGTSCTAYFRTGNRISTPNPSDFTEDCASLSHGCDSADGASAATQKRRFC